MLASPVFVPPLRSLQGAIVRGARGGPRQLAACVALVGSMWGAEASAAPDQSDGTNVLPSEGVSAPTSRRLEWRWRRFGLWEYFATAAVGLSAVYVELRTEQSPEPKWKSPVWFDPQARESLMFGSAESRRRASVASDYLGFSTQLWAYLDAGLVPLVTDRGNIDTAWQMTLINIQASALTALTTRGIDRLAARQRPDVEPCLDDPNYHEMCFKGPTSSFPSGHTSGAFTGAGLVCAHHAAMPLYASFTADVLACGLSASMAVTVAVLRMQADRHYATDVMAGALIGTTTGFLIPTFGHYWFVEVPHGAGVASRWSVAPQFGSAWGATLVGSL